MELKLGYKQTEVGVVPEDWEVASLGYFWNVTDCKHVTAKFIASGYPIASIKEVQSKFVDLTDAKRTTQQFYTLLIADGRKPRVGDLILSRNATVGEVAQVAEWHPPFAMGQDVCLLRKKSPDLSTNYLQCIFRSPIVANQLSDLMVGSTFKRVNIQQIRGFALPMPASAEQEAIAVALSDADALIESLERLIAKKRKIRQGAMQELLTGKKRLSGFNEKWGVHFLSQYFDLVSTRNQELNDNVVTISGQVGFVRQEEFFKKRVASKVLENYYLIERGDFAYNRSYSNGYPFGAIKRLTKYAKGVVTTLYICFALKPDADADSSFFEHYFEAGLLNSGLATVTNEGGRAHGLLNITKPDFFSRELNCPSGAEQTTIAAILSDMEVEIAALEAKLGKARHLKQGMMQELLTGRVRLV